MAAKTHAAAAFHLASRSLPGARGLQNGPRLFACCIMHALDGVTAGTWLRREVVLETGCGCYRSCLLQQRSMCPARASQILETVHVPPAKSRVAADAHSVTLQVYAFLEQREQSRGTSKNNEGVIPDLGNGDALEWVHKEHAGDEVTRARERWLGRL